MATNILLQKFHSEHCNEKRLKIYSETKKLSQTTLLFQFNAETNYYVLMNKIMYLESRMEVDFFTKVLAEVLRYSHHIHVCKLESSVNAAKQLHLHLYPCKVTQPPPSHELYATNQVHTVAHRGKTQLNFSSETQQSFEEHNNLFENTTIFFSTQQCF